MGQLLPIRAVAQGARSSEVTRGRITMADVVVAFGALRAVDGVTLSVPRGQRRAVIGPNGAGKTTLFNAITGMTLPTAGHINFDGHDITRLAPHRRARLGISRTFQITNLFPTLSVEDNMVLAVRGLAARKFSLFGTPALDRDEKSRITSALSAARHSVRAWRRSDSGRGSSPKSSVRLENA